LQCFIVCHTDTDTDITILIVVKSKKANIYLLAKFYLSSILKG